MKNADLRRKSTKIRHNLVHKANADLLEKLGAKMYWGLSRYAVYELISEQTGLSIRRIQYILNHTQELRK